MAQSALSSTTAEKQWIFPKSSVTRRFYWGEDSSTLWCRSLFTNYAGDCGCAGRRPNKECVGAYWLLTQGPIRARRSLLLSRRQRHDSARLSPTHAVKKGKRYRYYVSTALITRSRSEHPKGRRIPAGDIEGLVLDRLRAFFASGAEVSDAVAPLGLDAATQRAVLDRSAKLAERWTKLASLELRELVRSLVQHIQIGEAQILVWLNRTAIVSSVTPDAPPKPTEFVDFFRPVDRRKPSPGWKGCAAGDRQWRRDSDRRRPCLPARPSDRNPQHVPCGL